MKAEDYIFEKYGTTRTSKNGKLTTKIIAKLTTKKWYAAMEEYAQIYHESKVKNLSLSDVSNNEVAVCGCCHKKTLWIHNEETLENKCMYCEATRPQTDC